MRFKFRDGLHTLQHSPVGVTELDVRQAAGSPHVGLLFHRSYGQFHRSIDFSGTVSKQTLKPSILN